MHLQAAALRQQPHSMWWCSLEELTQIVCVGLACGAHVLWSGKSKIVTIKMQ